MVRPELARNSWHDRADFLVSGTQSAIYRE
jgi:hypothetical protein